MRLALSLRTLTAGLVLAISLAGAATAEPALDKVSFGTNWVAEGEHGGFYQALADGTYKKYGLDVTIVPGGPNVNNRVLLIAGKLDFFMTRQHAASLRRGRATTCRSSRSPRCSRRTRRFFSRIRNRRRRKVRGPEATHPVRRPRKGIASYFQWLKSDYRFRGRARSSPTPSTRSRFSPTRRARCRAM